MSMSSPPLFSPAPRGTVYGTLLNFRDALEALGDQLDAAPYKAPPKAPVLYIKPRNTWAGEGDAVVVPHDVDMLEIGVSIGLAIGRTACRVDALNALSHVSHLVVVNDINVPHASYYRPSMRFKCRDGFCPIGTPVPLAAGADPDAMTLVVEIDGREVQRSSSAGLIRPARRLLADVSEFMTLHPGDILMLGVPGHAPRARVGQRVTVAVSGVGRLSNTLVAEGAA